ncbi:hypothetical protein RHGRI_007265 [Rhododendron griersonianum]|uniref:Uncharacterized protein n=1 Tax=Rhododendron griersonianum TaxID=479676 RepID=A0AAV6KY30_9ERIC|nr:hypothetical protein RHGRI_007265 [Rhododendron griersonianum]
MKVRRDPLSLTLQPHPTTTAAAAGTPLPKPIFVIHYASISNSTDDNCLFAVELKSVTAVLRHCPNCNFPKLKSVTSIYTHVIPALALVFGSGNAEHVEGLFELVFEGWGNFMTGPVRILVKRDELFLEGIKQFFVAVEREEWKFDTLCDLYDTLSITQAVIFCNTKRKVLVSVKLSLSLSPFDKRGKSSVGDTIDEYLKPDCSGSKVRSAHDDQLEHKKSNLLQALIACVKFRHILLFSLFSDILRFIVICRDPSLVLPALVGLLYSSDVVLRSSASNTFVAVLKYHNEALKFYVCCSTVLEGQFCLYTCLVSGNFGVALAILVLKFNTYGNSFTCVTYSYTFAATSVKTQIFRKLQVEDWNLLVEPLIDKLFAEPSNAIIVKFLKLHPCGFFLYICESFHHVTIDYISYPHEYSYSSPLLFLLCVIDGIIFYRWKSHDSEIDNPVKLAHSLFDRLCPLLIIRLLPLRVFNNLDSSLTYGVLRDQGMVLDVHASDSSCYGVYVGLVHRRLMTYDTFPYKGDLIPEWYYVQDE